LVNWRKADKWADPDTVKDKASIAKHPFAPGHRAPWDLAVHEPDYDPKDAEQGDFWLFCDRILFISESYSKEDSLIKPYPMNRAKDC
jgi:hypothetical protein